MNDDDPNFRINPNLFEGDIQSDVPYKIETLTFGAKNESLMHICCKMGYVKSVEFLLKNYKIDLNFKDNQN